jgi:NAD(P)H dehydrogenase (quinone)
METRMTVAVTGASGHLGRKVADLVLDRLDAADVVLLTRTPEALGAYAERGAVVRHADFDEPASLAEAFAGVERALLISALDLERRIGQHTAAIDAARAAGVRHMLYTSISGADDGNPAAAAPSHHATEQALRDSGFAWTLLRNNLYAEYQVPVVEQAIASGQLVTSAGDGRVAYVSRDDCAAAAAAVLVQEGHERQAYDITGPEAIGPQELAALATELGGLPVEVVAVDDEALIAGMVAGGLPEPAARTLTSFAVAAREGFLGRVSNAVEQLTGRPPRSLRDVVIASREERSS